MSLTSAEIIKRVKDQNYVIDSHDFTDECVDALIEHFCENEKYWFEIIIKYKEAVSFTTMCSQNPLLSLLAGKPQYYRKANHYTVEGYCSKYKNITGASCINLRFSKGELTENQQIHPDIGVQLYQHLRFGCLKEIADHRLRFALFAFDEENKNNIDVYFSPQTQHLRELKGLMRQNERALGNLAQDHTEELANLGEAHTLELANLGEAHTLELANLRAVELENRTLKAQLEGPEK